jgi:hypothetical protein
LKEQQPAAPKDKKPAAGEKSAAPKEKKEKETLPPFQNDTPAGEKKVIRPFTDPYFEAYNPIAVEAAWYEWWEKSGFFKPETVGQSTVGKGKSFVIPLPPPNVVSSNPHTPALPLPFADSESLDRCTPLWPRAGKLSARHPDQVVQNEVSDNVSGFSCTSPGLSALFLMMRAQGLHHVVGSRMRSRRYFHAICC